LSENNKTKAPIIDVIRRMLMMSISFSLCCCSEPEEEEEKREKEEEEEEEEADEDRVKLMQNKEVVYLFKNSL
jgi:hypothetical protein